MMNKKNLIIVLAVVSIVIIALSVFFYLDSSTPTDTSEEAATETTIEEQVVTGEEQGEAEVLQRLEEPPEDYEPSSSETEPIEESFVYNDQIISPDTVASNPNDFLDKEITVRGWIVEPSEGFFLIVSVNSDEEKGLNLAKNNSINFSEYANITSENSKSTKPVNLTGTFSISEASSNTEFVVRLLDQ